GTRWLFSEGEEPFGPGHQIEYDGLDLLPHEAIDVARGHDSMGNENLADPALIPGALHCRGTREIRRRRFAGSLENRPEKVRVALHRRRDDRPRVEINTPLIISFRGIHTKRPGLPA